MLSFMIPALFQRSTSNAGSKLIIPIPRHKQWLHLPILIYWLMGWTFGELAAVNELNRQSYSSKNHLFLAWAILWTAGGVYGLFDLLWQLWGRQTLTIDAACLIHRRRLFGLSWANRYELARIHNIRIMDQPQPGRFSSSSIAFDYDAKTVRFDPDMDEWEVKQIANIIEKLILTLRPS